MAILHVTNGDSAAGELRTLFPGDAVLPWRDSLTDGPLPPGLDLEEFSLERAGFLAHWSGMPPATVLAEMNARNSLLARHAGFSETVLWFEHDLYDQLQLIQILDWFRGRRANLKLLQAHDYLGELPAKSLAALFPLRQAVTQAQLDLASSAWQAFRSPDPRALEPLLEHRQELPFLAGAIGRLCEEFPWVSDGLTRTERTVARLRAEGITGRGELFVAFCRTEEPRWMGDSSFFRILDGARDRAPGWLWDSTRRRFVRRPS